jgi:hypothetical protein
MLDGIPFRGAGWIVGNGERQPEGVGQLRLELGLPGAATIAVAAASVTEDEDLGKRLVNRIRAGVGFVLANGVSF